MRNGVSSIVGKSNALILQVLPGNGPAFAAPSSVDRDCQANGGGWFSELMHHNYGAKSKQRDSPDSAANEMHGS